MAFVTIAGTQFLTTNGYRGPLDIQRKPSKVGVSLVADDGTRNFIYRQMKQVWTLPFNGLTAAQRNFLYARYALSSTFTFIDELGTSYTVQCEDGDYEDSIFGQLLDGTLLYNVTITLRET